MGTAVAGAVATAVAVEVDGAISVGTGVAVAGGSCVEVGTAVFAGTTAARPPAGSAVGIKVGKMAARAATCPCCHCQASQVNGTKAITNKPINQFHYLCIYFISFD